MIALSGGSNTLGAFLLPEDGAEPGLQNIRSQYLRIALFKGSPD